MQRAEGDAPKWVVLVPGAVALVICSIQLTVGVHWDGVVGYDDGVYVGSAVLLAHGLIPYRDFVYVQPPGLTLLLTPFALLFRALGLGSQDMFALSRILTGVVTAASASLVALIVRHRGIVAMLVAGTAFACFPPAPIIDSQAYTEPYMVLCCLIGVALLFRRSAGGAIGTSAAPVLAGVAFGLGCAFKVVAVLPLVCAVGCLVATDRSLRRAARLLAGAAAALVVVAGPFFVLAPGNFVTDVVRAQTTRLTVGGSAIALRLDWVLGLEPLHLTRPEGAIAAVAVVVLVAAAILHSRRTPISTLEWFCVASAVLVGVVLLVTTPFFAHYSLLATPWIAVLAGSVVGRALAPVTVREPGRSTAPATLERPTAPATLAVRQVVVLVVALVVFTGTLIPALHQYRDYDVVRAEPATLAAVRAIPAHACIVTDDASFLVAANRLADRPPSCPATLDAVGIGLVDAVRFGTASARTQMADRVRQWEGVFSRADGVLLTRDQLQVALPWNLPLRRWFHGHFKEVSSNRAATVYQRRVGR